MGTVDSVDYSECVYLVKTRDGHIKSVKGTKLHVAPWVTELVGSLRAATWMSHTRIYLTGSHMERSNPVIGTWFGALPSSGFTG